MTKRTFVLSTLLTGVSFLTGCASVPSGGNIARDENTARAACYAQHQSAFVECQDFLRHESNTLTRDRQMIQCMRNKGFPSGADTCRQY